MDYMPNIYYADVSLPLSEFFGLQPSYFYLLIEMVQIMIFHAFSKTMFKGNGLK